MRFPAQGMRVDTCIRYMKHNAKCYMLHKGLNHTGRRADGRIKGKGRGIDGPHCGGGQACL